MSNERTSISLSPQELAVILEHVKNAAQRDGYSAEWIERGWLPMPIDFASPVPELRDLRERDLFSKRSSCVGIDLRMDAQNALLETMSKRFGAETQWPDHAQSDPTMYHNINVSFGHHCAASTHYMVRQFRPRRVIEVGSGMSSRVIGAALRMNAAEDGKPFVYEVVDPFPLSEIEAIKGVTKFHRSRVELTDPAAFSSLESNDILFIDSSHIFKTGSDLHFLMLEIVPRVNPGVLVHFHDIPLPFEYGEAYFKQRVFWNESYCLELFLSHNSQFEVMLGMMAIAHLSADRYPSYFPFRKPTYPTSGSFWIRRKNAA